jgi:hypothetical protein
LKAEKIWDNPTRPSGWTCCGWSSTQPRSLLQTEDGLLGVGEFLVAAVVAAIGDEFPGGREIVLREFPRVRFSRWMSAKYCYR